MRTALARLAAAALAAAALAGPGAGAAIEGFPGATWGNLGWDLPSEGEQDLVLEGWVRQGVAWHRWALGGAGLVLHTYGTVRYRADSAGLDWNDLLGAGGGAALDLAVPRMPALTAGAEWIEEWRWRSGSTRPYTALFVNWFEAWGFQRGAWPGSTWGEVRWELPSDARENLVAQGWARQGVVLERWQRDPLALVLAPYLRVRWKVDSLGLDWNNTLGPGVGLGLDLDGLKGLQPGVGIEYAWEKNLRSAGSVHRLELVLRWYGWWDLARR